MALVNKRFDFYRVYYYSGNPAADAIIVCSAGSTAVGHIYFYKDGSQTPPNQNIASGPVIRYPVSRFNDVMSILRFEKPLFLFLNTESLAGAVGTAEQEPVGEQE